jgi:hypothetical protein
MRSLSILMLAVFAQGVVLPYVAHAQDTFDCAYNRNQPTLENARLLFKITDYRCAEMELKDLLASDSLGLQTRADAHVLLAAVYYAKLRDEEEKESKVMAELVAAFKAFREWRGELDIKSEEFRSLLEKAKKKVDEQAEQEAQAAVEDTTTTEQEPAAMTDTWSQKKTEKKPWYKKWWVLGLGVGVVATGVVLAAGGGGDDGGTEAQPLPGFPGHPGE